MTLENKTIVPFEWLRKAASEEEKEKIVALLTNNTVFTKLFLSILRDKYETLDLKNYSRESYQNPNDFATLAFNNGKASAFLEIANLFEFRNS